MSTETEETPRNPFARKRFIVSAVFLGAWLLIGAGVSLSIWWDQRSWERDTTVAACERPTSKDLRLNGALPVNSWESIGPSALPVTDFGPSREAGGIPVCYEPSPQGAAIAAVHVATLASNGSTSGVLEHMAVDSQATRDQLASTDVETVPEDPTRALAVRLADYTPEEAIVTVVMETTMGPHAMDFTMVWDEGDWKWDTPTESMSAYPLTNLSGYNSLGGADG